MPTITTVITTVALLALGLCGGLLALLVGLPLPYMLGSLVATAALALGVGRLLPDGYLFPQRLRLVFIALIGVMIGAASRILLMAGAVAGQIIGYQTGLAMAQSFDPTQGQSGALPAQFLNLMFMVLIFVTNLHHYLLLTAAQSYEMIPAGSAPAVGDAASWALQLFIDAFALAVQIASPLIAFGLVFYLGLGVLSRLMPQAQIFFIAMPLNILIGFAILAMTLGAIALVWLERFEQFAVTMS